MSIEYDLLKVTEATAAAAYDFIGLISRPSDNISLEYNTKTLSKELDASCTTVMKSKLNSLPYCMYVNIGEGKKDGADGVFRGDYFGDGFSKDGNYYLAVDVVEGSTACIKGQFGAWSIIAVSDAEFFSTNYFYVKKVAYGPKVANFLQKEKGGLLGLSLDELIYSVGAALNKRPENIVVCLLQRERNAEYVERFRELGCNVRFIENGDVLASINAAYGRDVDLYFGIGGATEAVLAAAAIRCLGGGLELKEVYNVNGNFVDVSKSFSIDEIAPGNVAFVGTSITGVSTSFCEIDLAEVTKSGADSVVFSANGKNRKCEQRVWSNVCLN